MRPKINGAALLLLMAWLSAPAVCQDSDNQPSKLQKSPLPEYVQEFFLSDAVRNQDRGEWQLTLGVDARESIGTTLALKTEYGLTNRVQLSFELPYGASEEESHEASSNWRTASVGARYQLLRSQSPVMASVGMALGIPVRSGGEVEYQPTILLARSFQRAQVHASFAADIEREKPSFEYNVAAVYPLRSRWFPTAEFNGRSLRGRRAFYLTPGLYRHFPHRLEFGLGIPLGLGGVAGAAGVVCKLNWEIGGQQ